MTKLEELREFQKELDADPNFVDVKFTAGDPEICKNATLEEIAADALVLLKGTPNGIDVSEEIF